jgi:hypothetical protein
VSNRAKRKGCVGKVFHKTLEAACTHARHTLHGHAYKCDFCSGYHVGGSKRASLSRAFVKAGFNP